MPQSSSIAQTFLLEQIIELKGLEIMQTQKHYTYSVESTIQF